MITLTDFSKLEIKIGTIIAVEKVAGADKLLKLKLEFGQFQRQILAGIAEFYQDSQQLLGKQVPVIVNLEPRKIRGEESQGMMLAVDVAGRPILLHPSETVPAGSIVR